MRLEDAKAVFIAGMARMNVLIGVASSETMDKVV